jgi:hypothetical protein
MKFGVMCSGALFLETAPTHQRIVPKTHQNALRDRQITPDVKTQFRCNVFQRAICGTSTGPTRAGKIVHQCVSWPGCNGTHYLTQRSLWMQKHKFRVMCSDVHFVESAPGLSEHQK